MNLCVLTALCGPLCFPALGCTDVTLAGIKCQDVCSTIIPQLGDSENFWKWRFPLRLQWSSSTPTEIELSCRGSFLCWIKDRTSEDMLNGPVWAQHYAVHLQAGIFFSPFFYFFYKKKWHRADATTGIFQVLGTAETLRNKCYNFNRGGARLQTDFQYKRSGSRDHSLQFSASSALKRC